MLSGKKFLKVVSAVAMVMLFLDTLPLQTVVADSSTQADNYFGSAVSLSSNTFGIRTPGEDRWTTGINGNQALHMDLVNANAIQPQADAYDPQYSLPIDPTLTWNTFLGGSNSDSGSSIAVDGNGNIYVVGESGSTWGTPVQAYSGFIDVFVAKLDSSGNLIWNSFLGGNGYDYASSIALDESGNVYVAGTGGNWGSPIRPHSGSYDAFAAKLDSSGNLTWNTFLGGSGIDFSGSIAVNGNGNIYVAGSSDTPWGSPIQTHSSYIDAFAAKLDSSGNLTWNTFLGGSGTDDGNSIAVDGSGNVYVAGSSDSTWGSPIQTHSTYSDAFTAKLDSFGNLTWNTFLGGSGTDDGNSIAVDGIGNVYLAGQSDATWGSPIRAYSTGDDAFAAKLDSSGDLTWNTFLGGSGPDDYGASISVNGIGNVYLAGYSDAAWGNPVQAYTNDYDGFAVKLDSSGGLTWNTFVGGSGSDLSTSIAVNGNGNVYLTGTSYFTWGNPVQAYLGAADAFVAKISMGTTTSTFGDVADTYWAFNFIERLYHAGITGGCTNSPLNYCPDNPVTRAQMAIFLEKALHGSAFTPPNVSASFSDTSGHWAEDWIEALKSDGITSGCAAGLYCPENAVTRAQMAVFILKAKHGSIYTPPSASGIFSDVPADYWAAAWIEQLAAEGITNGCAAGVYCPESPVTRAQMAVFLVKAFNLP